MDHRDRERKEGATTSREVSGGADEHRKNANAQVKDGKTNRNTSGKKALHFLAPHHPHRRPLPQDVERNDEGRHIDGNRTAVERARATAPDSLPDVAVAHSQPGAISVPGRGSRIIASEQDRVATGQHSAVSASVEGNSSVIDNNNIASAATENMASGAPLSTENEYIDMVEAELVQPVPQAEIVQQKSWLNRCTAALVCFAIAFLGAGAALTGILCGTGFCSNDKETPSAPPCYTSDMCDDGTFCSTLTRTCLPLTCQNWVKGPPDEYKNYPFAEKPCKAEGFNNGSSFCGRDGNCHYYNCPDLYFYGPQDITGHDPDMPMKLNCWDYKSGPAYNTVSMSYTDNMTSVVFGCRPYWFESEANETFAVPLQFSRACHVMLRGWQTFECYDNGNDAKVNYQDYIEKVTSMADQVACEEDPAGEWSKTPLFWYPVFLRSNFDEGSFFVNDTKRQKDIHSSTSFNATEAGTTIYAVFTKWSQDLDFAGSASSAIVGYRLIIVLLVMVFQMLGCVFLF